MKNDSKLNTEICKIYIFFITKPLLLFLAGRGPLIPPTGVNFYEFGASDMPLWG